MWRCLRDPTFSRFSRILTCDRQTDTTTEYTVLAWRRVVKIDFGTGLVTGTTRGA